jgi:putative tryptophan/tyrosine transport system substrate-binding protein
VRELVPGATRIGMLVNASNRGNVFHLKAAKAAAIALGITLVPIEVRLPEDIDPAFHTLAQEHAQLLLIIPEALFLNERQRIVALTAAAHMPTIYGRCLSSHPRRSACPDGQCVPALSTATR